MEVSGCLPDLRIVEYPRKRAREFPGAEEGRPVDAIHEIAQIVRVERFQSQKRRLRRFRGRPIDGRSGLARALQRVLAATLIPAMISVPNAIVFLFDARHELITTGIAHQGAGDSHRP